MRIVDENRNEITEAYIDLSKGKVIQTIIVRPDAKPVDDVTKFAYEDEDYETVIQYIRIPDAELIESQIADFKRKLADTDYNILKIVEGVATVKDLAEVIFNRKEWRQKINELEAELATIKSE